MENVKKHYLLLTLLIAVIFIWYVQLQSSDKLVVAILDVGQGDAIFIEAPNGQQILIDGGPDKKVLRELSSVMPFYDRTIDVVIATHPDKDHIGGLPDVLKRYSVTTFIDPGVEHDTGTYKTLEEMIEDEGAERITAEQNMSLSLGDDVFLHILFPDRNVRGIESNTASVITQLIHGDIEFLFTGDSPQSIEKYLVSIYGEKLQSDVLKVGHHGSKTSSAELFLNYVDPEYAVISAGEDNRYGHPHVEVVNAFNNIGASILTTFDDGTIIFESDGTNLKRK